MKPSARFIPPLRTLACGAALLSLTTTVGCGSQQKAAPDDQPTVSQTPPSAARDSLTAAERAEGWRLLFDGRTTNGWRGYKQQAMPDGWQVIDGELRRVAQAGDIITVEQFGDFELALDWKVGPGGNSGIFYRVTESGEESYHTGIEMQVLDDAGHADGRNRLTSAGSLYGLYPVPEGVVKPAGQWNSARIVVRGNHVEHWLNEQQVVQAEMWSPDWNTRLAASKFTQWPDFARATRGHIGLQDHGDRVSYRNIRIREVK